MVMAKIMVMKMIKNVRVKMILKIIVMVTDDSEVTGNDER